MFKCISVAPNRKAKPTVEAIKKDQAAQKLIWRGIDSKDVGLPGSRLMHKTPRYSTPEEL